MVADDKQRETMRRNLKYERISRSLIYSKLHQAVSSFLASPVRDRSVLARCRAMIETERDTAESPQRRDNAIYALRSLDQFEASLNALPIAGLVIERAPLAHPHIIHGVRVSIQPTVLVRVNRPRGAPLRGAIAVDLAKGDTPKSEAIKARMTQAMTYSAMLLHEHVGNSVIGDGERSSPDHCQVFHSHRQELVCSPTNYRRDLANMEASCRTAAALWQDIEPPASFDPALAIYRN
ncbi:hypothetical protein [Dongia deserti]|uniref:hypothetical protein n=1 Tax=Dongia deserti TaxID=2268030 RepID=UPI0013C44389|nr:hypothetical protein [Dongia deserti]